MSHGSMERVCVKLGALLLALVASLVLSAGPVSAKGSFPTRGYAVITGPGLPHPLVYVAPWKASRGGYYSGEAEIFLALANHSGATPAGRLHTGGGDFVPYGVLPIKEAPSAASLGPRYRLTWFRDGLKEVAKQDIYPYAPARPVVYTLPSSRRALVVLFGRFQDPARLWTGWGRATSFDLLRFLQAEGLPAVAPVVGDAQGNAPPGTPTTWPSPSLRAGAATSSPRSGLVHSLALCAGVLPVLVLPAVLWARRRRRETGAALGLGR